MKRLIIALAIHIHLVIGTAYGICGQQLGFDTHNYLLQNGKLVGAVYRPKLGCSETSSEYTEHWILFKEFVRFGKTVNGKEVSTTVMPAKSPVRSLNAFTKLYKKRSGNTYVNSYVTESTEPFLDPTGAPDEADINQHEPDVMGLIVQRGKSVGAHWRDGPRLEDGSYAEYWVLTPDFVYPSHRTAASRKGMIMQTAKNKVYSYDEFLSRVSFLNITKYVRVVNYESKIPFDRQS